MNSSRIYILVLAALMAISDAFAVTHFFTMGADGGMAAEYCPRDSSKWAYGGMGGLQIGYELNHNGFLFSLGVGGQYSHVTGNVSTKETITGVNDGDPFSLNEHDNLYSVLRTTKLSRQRALWAIRIPLFIGYQANIFYAKAGVVMSLHPFQSKMQEVISITDVIHYDAFQDDFNSHPLVPTTYQETASSSSFSYPMYNISPAIEMGCTFNSNSRNYWRIGLFAEYEVLHDIHPLQAGIRITWLYAFPARRSYPCKCLVF